MLEQISKCLDDAFGDSNLFEEPAHTAMRASSLPFCGRQYVMHRLGPFEPMQDLSFFGQACMDMGTALHSTAQRYLGHSGLLYGNWTCSKCSAFYRDRQGPVTCCGLEATYTEYELQHECGISAHPDGVLLQLPDGTPVRALLEIKGIHEKKLAALKAPIWRHSSFQANFYANLLNDKLNLGIERIVLIYIDRGVPSRRKYFLVKPNRSVYEQTIHAVEEAKRQLHLRVLPERICATSLDGKELHCQYRHICFVPDEKLQQMIAANPPPSPLDLSAPPSSHET